MSEPINKDLAALLNANGGEAGRILCAGAMARAPRNLDRLTHLRNGQRWQEAAELAAAMALELNLVAEHSRMMMVGAGS